MDNLLADLKKEYGETLKNQAININELENKINTYKNISSQFQQRLNSFNRTQWGLN